MTRRPFGARRAALCLAILSVFAGLPAIAAASAPIYARGNAHTIHAYMMLIRLRTDLYSRWKDTGKWPADAAANAALEGHSKYWNQQLRSGRAIVAGGMNGDYWDNIALIIFEAKDLAEAQAIVGNDPAVKAYVFQAQVRPFDLAFITNKFDVEAAQGAAKSK